MEYIFGSNKNKREHKLTQDPSNNFTTTAHDTIQAHIWYYAPPKSLWIPETFSSVHIIHHICINIHTTCIEIHNIYLEIA